MGRSQPAQAQANEHDVIGTQPGMSRQYEWHKLIG
jgi:hypothetical protein